MKSPQRSDMLPRSTLQSTPCNLVFVGAEGVGKTTMLRQFTTGVFQASYVPTTLETMIHCHDVDGCSYKLHLCDSSGSSDFRVHRASYLAEADGIVFVFSTTDRNSLQCLINYAEEVLHVRKQSGLRKSIPILLIGTCTDNVQQRHVTLSEAERVASNCLSLLNVRQERQSKRKYNIKKFHNELPVGISTTHPVVEITNLSPFEVTRAIQAMIRMVQYFRAHSRLPTSDVLYPHMEAANLSFPPPNILPYLQSSSDDDIDRESLVTTGFDDVSYIQNKSLMSKMEKEMDGGVLSESSYCTIHDRESIGRKEIVDQCGSTPLVIMNGSHKTPSEKESYSERENAWEDREARCQPVDEIENENQRQQYQIRRSNYDGSTRYQSAWVAAEMCEDPPDARERRTSYDLGSQSTERTVKVGVKHQRCPNCRVM
ncbi:putative small GTP-binding protein RAB6 [Trypanosoma theileri]|uniref:Putative small GTP-binding protein RAB6 n=1 Tax=Trypanosoma theileri TaxID=67003 RepID=A0A1X0P8S9_9TRYP|nr:putative small GTP-binding protein RAB6 [Trypanosoma theileri]ORC92999.1 putative small GTP-binding protein RAB6 [Trypanosoma theileri]